MGTKSASSYFLKVLFAFSFLSISFLPVFSQKKNNKKKLLASFSKKEKRMLKKLEAGDLIAYKENIEGDITVGTSFETTLSNNYISESGEHCNDFYYNNLIQKFQVFNAVDSILLFEQKTASIQLEGDICVDDAFVFLNDSQTVIPTEYLTNSNYFGIWDSKNVDPYGYGIKDFDDTVSLKLYKNDNWAAPVKSTVINSVYGLRRWRWHHGIDLDIQKGDSIYAAFDGIVRIAKYNWGGYGNYVLLRHKNGLETLYGHLTKYLVKVGQEVKAGELIGWGGNTGRSTGPHLHFETRYQGHAFNPSHLYNFEKDSLLYNEFTLTAKHYKGIINRSKSIYHRIRSGDTLSHLAVRYGTSISRICRLNGISRRTTLRIGRSLRMR